MIFDSILQTIGKTPLVKLSRVGRHLPCNLYAKCEFFNPGGSIKDRIAIAMVEDAERSGRIKPGDTLIEPTSGNTGIGLALVGAVKGYQVIITMPEKMSKEKQVVLEALGAKIIRTPTEAAWDAPESHIGVARKLVKELPNAHILDQYSNKFNPRAHYDFTAQEIIEELDTAIDMVVIAAGTGGTISGVAKRIKEVNPNCVIIGVDPVGSILAKDEGVASYKVEGIGYDFIPEVLDRSLIDRWVKTNDRQSFLLARRLIKEEGMLCGGSSGAALFAALQEAAKLEKGQNCVVLLPDGVRNYLTKFVNDKWMKDNRFTEKNSHEGTLKDILKFQTTPVTVLDESASLKQAIKLMREKSFSQIPVTERGKLVGILKEEELLEKLMCSEINTSTSIDLVMNRNVCTVGDDTPIAVLQDLLLSSGSVVVVDSFHVPMKIVTQIDLVEWLSQK